MTVCWRGGCARVSSLVRIATNSDIATTNRWGLSKSFHTTSLWTHSSKTRRTTPIFHIGSRTTRSTLPSNKYIPTASLSTLSGMSLGITSKNHCSGTVLSSGSAKVIPLVAAKKTSMGTLRGLGTAAFDLSKLYHIEVSNAQAIHKDANQNDNGTTVPHPPAATTITVRGPDIDGIMASMTVALATHGCSLMELHAAMAADSAHAHVPQSSSESSSSESSSNSTPMIEDVFLVVDRRTGKPFDDDLLQDLGQSLLKALEKPLIPVLRGSEQEEALQRLVQDVQNGKLTTSSELGQISVIKSTDVYDFFQQQ